MKTSYYNHLIEKEGHYYLYNSISDSYVSVTGSALNLIENGQFAKLTPEALCLLKKKGIIVPDDFDEYQSLIELYENSINNDIYNMVLIPTLDCNVKCWYCFETQKQGSKFNKIIVDSIVKHLLYVIKTQSNINKFVIEFFGGEPLLHFKEDIYPLLLQINQLMKSFNKGITFLFITNGICLDEETIDLLKDFKVNFQVSIDGYREKHDSVKKIKNNEKASSYDLVMRNICNLTNLLDTHVNLRINYDNNTLSHVTELIDSIKNIPKRKLTVHFERVWQTIAKSTPDNLQFKYVIDKFIIEGFCVTYMNFFHKGYSCKASKANQLVIDYLGNVYKCSGRDFTDNHKEGILRRDGTVAWNEEKVAQRLSIKTFDNEMCRSCKLLPLCWGPCCQKQMESNDDKALKKMCQLNKLDMSIGDYLYFRMKSKQNRLRAL